MCQASFRQAFTQGSILRSSLLAQCGGNIESKKTQALNSKQNGKKRYIKHACVFLLKTYRKRKIGNFQSYFF